MSNAPALPGVVSYRHGSPGPAQAGRGRALTRSEIHRFPEGNHHMLEFIRTITGRRDEDGASAVEYGLLVAGIAALIVAIVFVFGGVIKSAFSKTCGVVSSKGSASATC